MCRSLPESGLTSFLSVPVVQPITFVWRFSDLCWCPDVLAFLLLSLSQPVTATAGVVEVQDSYPVFIFMTRQRLGDEKPQSEGRLSGNYDEAAFSWLMGRMGGAHWLKGIRTG